MDRIKPAILFFMAALIFVVSGIVPMHAFLLCFTNESVLSIFLLIFITAGLKANFNVIEWLDRLFRKATTPRAFTLRMSSGVALISGFINNTPLVALMIPYVYQWARKHKIAPSRLLMALSYSAMLGGMITLIGTSTNLVLNGLITAKGDPGLQFTDFLWLGLAVSIAGVLLMYFFGHKLFPSHSDLMDEWAEQQREYLIETRVPDGSHLIGQTLQKAGLRNLKGVYLFEIVREQTILSPIAPDEIIQQNDVLFFAGDTGNVTDLLHNNNGLIFPQQQESSWEMDNMVEVVVPANSDLIGKTLKGMEFRTQYNAAVIALHRNGEKVRGKIGEIVLKAGDLLLVIAGKGFKRVIQQNHNLYPVSVINHPAPASSLQKGLFVSVLGVVLALLVFGKISLFLGLLLITTVMLLSRLLTITEIKRQMDIELLVILAASLAFSKALIGTGTAAGIAHDFMRLFNGMGPQGLLVGLFLLTLILTTFVTNVAVVAILFPIVYALCHGMGYHPVPFYVALAFAASCSFHSSFSYQTNLMVMGPGNYRFKDFLRAGLPLTLLYSIICIIFILFYYNL